MGGTASVAAPEFLYDYDDHKNISYRASRVDAAIPADPMLTAAKNINPQDYIEKVRSVQTVKIARYTASCLHELKTVCD